LAELGNVIGARLKMTAKTIMAFYISNYEGNERVEHDRISFATKLKVPFQTGTLETNVSRFVKNEVNLHMVLI
jgi:hypothetical protein